MFGTTRCLRYGLGIFFEKQLGMDKQEARQAAKWASLGIATFVLVDFSSVVETLAENGWDEFMHFVTEGKLDIDIEN